MNTIKSYQAPKTVKEAVQVMANGESTLFAGATDLLPQKKSLKNHLVNIRRIPELHGIAEQEGRIRIGALTTVTDLLKSELLQDKASIFPKCADCFASCQVRNSATLGGNVCNASPAGDMIIPLILLDAEVELASWSGSAIKTRKVPVTEFFTGPGSTVMASNEILTYFHFQPPKESFRSAFKKFGLRPAMDISVISVGISGELSQDKLSNVRVAFGAVAPTPIRGYKTEEAIQDKTLEPELFKEAGRIAKQEVSPISDVRASAWYRKELIGVFTERALQDVHKTED